MRLVNKTIYILAKTLRQLGVKLHEETDSRIIEMKKEIQRLGGKIEFKIEQFPNGSWTAESVNVDGIITGGMDVKEMASTMRDAIFTYFSVPPYLCNDTLLRADNEPVTLKQHVYA